MTAAPPRASAPSRAVRTVALALLVAAPFIGLAAYRGRGHQVGGSDFDDFHRTIRHGLVESARPTMSPEWGVFNYHPFVVVVLAPLAWLPMPAACVVFLVASVTVFALAAGAFLRELLPDDAPRRAKTALAATLLVSPYLASSLLLGQFETLLLALVLGAWVLARRGRAVPAGLLVAAAALLKAYPAFLLIWFLMKRQWRTTAAILAGLLVGGWLLPVMLFGPAENARIQQDWWSRAVVGNSALGELARTSGGMWRYSIEALPILLRRYLTPQPYAEYNPATLNFVSLSREPLRLGPLQLAPLQWIYVGLAGLALLGLLLTIRRPWRSLAPRAAAREYALVTLAAVLLSPTIWASRYFALAWPACVLLWLDLRAPPPPRVRPVHLVFAAWVLALFLWTVRLRALGVHFWAAVLLALWLAAFRAPHRAPDACRRPRPSL